MSSGELNFGFGTIVIAFGVGALIGYQCKSDRFEEGRQYGHNEGSQYVKKEVQKTLVELDKK